MNRVVLDTNVLVAGLRGRNGASFAVLGMIAQQRLRPLVTTALFLEYESVLKRPDHLRIHGFPSVGIDAFMAGFAALAEPVDPQFLWRPQLVDPGDEMVLEAAVNGRADALVTHNGRHFSSAAVRFGLPVLRPLDILKEVMP